MDKILSDGEEELPWTGERYVPQVSGEIELEHLHRYALARELSRGKSVLDIACGEGYGSALLAEVAEHVTGVDIAEDAIAHARTKYQRPNLEFRSGSCDRIPLPDASIDLAVSFETIEHHANHREMMAEIRRVLRLDGILIISSPDKYEYSDVPGFRNEFHVKELYLNEFEALLRTQFRNVGVFGQRVHYGSWVAPLSGAADTSTFATFRGGPRSIQKTAGLHRPVYFVALASNAALPEISAGLFEGDQAVAKRDGQIESLKQVLAERDGQIASLNQAIAERDRQIASLSDETVQRGEWALGLDRQLKEVQLQIAQITSSNSWRITRPLREVRRWLTNPSLHAHRYARGIAKLVKRTYLRLPFSYQTRTKQRLFLVRHAPWILRLANGQPVSLRVMSLPIIADRTIADRNYSAGDIRLPTSREPVVSIIIPIYGKCEYTVRCLASIAANPPSALFEVIVVNDCSPDNSAETLTVVDGIQLISNSENRGFIRSCNIGARAAKGRYLHFLNNDTEVAPGWLDELVRTFHEFPGTGLVGSKLVYPDGTLQEAGGIIWNDGSAWNFGRNQDAALPIYNYAREVDYCSGASVMVPKKFFDEVGGFDEHYLPAYCEDSDMALRLRDRGYRVIYQPLSLVVHHEGISSGTDLNQGAKSYQVENSKKLFERWRQRLRRHQVPGTDVDRAKDRAATRRVLVIDHCTPTPSQDAGSVTVFNLLLLLREMEFQVTFIPEDNFLYMPDFTPALQRAGIEVLYAPYCRSVENHLREVGERYDLVFLFRPGVVERHLKAVQKHCPKAKVLYHTIDLHYLRLLREADLHGDATKARAASEMRARELAAIRGVDASIVHSTAELDLLRHDVPNERIHVFPLIMDIPGTKVPFQDRRDIVFVGGYQHAPNVNAVQYCVAEMMPLLRSRLPGIKLHIVGSNVPDSVRNLARDDVVIEGFVEDLTSFLDQMRVSVVPLRYGAGIKGKIGTAMAVGLPTVATPVAAEGMSLTHNANILIADGAEALAESITEIYQDESLWNAVSREGLDFAEKAWGAEAAWKILGQILCDLGMESVRGLRPLKLYSPDSGQLFPGKEPCPTSGVNELAPFAAVSNRAEYEQAVSQPWLTENKEVESRLLDSANAAHFEIVGFCAPCEKEVRFAVNTHSGGQRIGSRWYPNWRETIECPICGMKNRERLIATLVKEKLEGFGPKTARVYFMEQVTPVFSWASRAFPLHEIAGSEYLGHQYYGGTTVNGVRHEDVGDLSFENNSIDLIVSNDVFEHVEDVAKAIRECARVLKSGGVMLVTIPFHSGCDHSVIRAETNAEKVIHRLPPVYHGNPISADGSLVFADFGWDVLTLMKSNGFSSVKAELYNNPALGHLGGDLVVFRAMKAPVEAAIAIDTGSKSDARHSLTTSEDEQENTSGYAKKVQQELAIYEKQAIVHDLPKIFHYWSNKHLKPIFQEADIDSIEDFFVKSLLTAHSRTGTRAPRFVSIGAGNCDLEVTIARRLQESGCREFVLECLELNSTMLNRGREMARDLGVYGCVSFVEGDFNNWKPILKYDGVMANQSLHHVVALEHLFEQVGKGLHAKGSLIISDMIGRNGHQRWPESLALVNGFWKELPTSYRYNVILNRHERKYENWDCSQEGFEGIRAQAILPLLMQRFYCEKFIGFGSAIDIFVDRCFGHHFDPTLQRDMDFIDRVHRADEEGLQNGTLTPTHMLAVFVKEPVASPFFSRGLTPEQAIRQEGNKTFRPGKISGQFLGSSV